MSVQSGSIKRKNSSLSPSSSRWFGKMLAGFVGTAMIVGVPAIAAAGKPPPPPPPPPAAKELNDQYFDWFINTTPGYIPSPFLSDATVHGVNAFLEQQPAGAPRAVKIQGSISNATANLIFNNPKYNVSYVLGDLEGPNTKNEIKELAEQVRFINGQNNGTKTRSFNAFIGNFGFANLSNDSTNPKNYKNNQKDKHSFSGWTKGDFDSAKLNLNMPEMYAGSPSQRNPAAGNSNAPNIRSALFSMPIQRLSQVTVNSKPTERAIPYIARFNNWGNDALDTDRNPSNGWKFEPGKAIPAGRGFPALSASQTTNQMLSRRDFAAQVAHYRLRGADSFVLFEPGVVGYLNDEKRNDAKTGWTESHIDDTFKAADATLVLGKYSDYKNGTNDKDPNGNIIIDGKDRSIEQAGALFSGVFSLSLKKMDVLLSNMDDDEHSLTLPDEIAGFDLKTKSFDVDGGNHLLVEYKLTTSGINRGWSVALQQPVFTNLSNNRSGIGIPEPTSFSIIAGMAFIAFSPRRRKRDADEA